MAYTTIDKPQDHFNIKLYTGNGSTNAQTGVGFQPDWLWFKNRVDTYNHHVFDSTRGVNKQLQVDSTGAESTYSTSMTSFDSDGFTLGNNNNINYNGNKHVAWCWKAGGTAPAITYTVKVVSDSGNKYRFDDFGTSAVTLDLQEGGTYTFDQSDSSNAGHPLRFSTTSNGTHGGGSEYTTGVTTNGTPGSSGAYTRITVASGAATLYYYCTQHSGMGGQANTNSLFGSSNFSGSVQSTVSANTTSGFSIVRWTGTGSNATVGHGLSSAPTALIIKNYSRAGENWRYMNIPALGNTTSLQLDNYGQTSGGSDIFNNTSPTSTVFTVGTAASVNYSSSTMIAYCFHNVRGYQKVGNYNGNGNANGVFVYCGFKPAWILTKNKEADEDWKVHDVKRDGYNRKNDYLQPSNSGAESGTSNQIDIVGNGFKIRNTNTAMNANNDGIPYIAIADRSLVGSNGVPTLAR